jgi:hypothetical protein
MSTPTPTWMRPSSRRPRWIEPSGARTGGWDYKERLRGGVPPAIYGGFRENVRLLLADTSFRRPVTTPLDDQPATPARGLAPIAFAGVRIGRPIGKAVDAVAVVFAADGSGSGFLISSDGCLLTNQHAAQQGFPEHAHQGDHVGEPGL